ncbi:arginine/ornithine antiporter arcD [Vibrio ishigakensis]|uniref:Arginine/ornithine antiporter arcD n=1 Tax=Vibrio ishigakensis TaxID=1481914 RepID=A0A0B8NGZ5_9VIBR|nr:arginine/ornithine antiporter arcD [Vibrio ishigakensis]
MSTKTSRFKLPTVYTILFLIIALVAAMTWVIPAGKYDYKTADTGQLIKLQMLPTIPVANVYYRSGVIH